jgi:RHS repeat-associated protein
MVNWVNTAGIYGERRWVYQYDALGRVWRTLLPDGTSVTNEYFLTGLRKKTYGSRTYPVEYTYDAQGRLKTLTTWTNFASAQGAATTTWNYDAQRGWLTNKVYADGKGPSYTYTDAGRVQTRTWARGLTTTYGCNHAGDLATIVYSDGVTANVTNTYDRRGRRISWTTASSSATLTYDDAGNVLSETHTGGPLAGLALTNGYDALLRRTVVGLSNSAALTTYGYDAVSRLSTATNGDQTVAYTYLANSPLVSQITFKQSGTTRMTATKSYDNLNRLTRIESVPSGSSPVSFNYGYNSANQRIAVTNADNSRWAFGYDGLGQVTSGKKYWGDATLVAGQQFEYSYDDIGNRVGAKAGGDAVGAGLRPASYSVNNLNQYTHRTVPGYLNILGTASTNATVAVNNQATVRQGEYFWKELAVANGSAAVWQTVTNAGVIRSASTNNPDVMSTVTGNLFVPQTPETFGYDLDGNLTNDGRWVFTWDAENRLTKVESLASGPTASKRKVVWDYDGKGRRVRQTTYDGSSGSYVVTEDLKFLSEGWHCIAELNATNNALLRGFVWGLDLSGTMTGAGGVGGLLMINSAANGSHFYAYDGNGNVTALVKANDGTVSALYEYDPFGQTLRATGPMANENAYGFSTKRTGRTTAIIHYEYRPYLPWLGRWPSRDPIAEKGGLNLCGFVKNDALNRWDILGLIFEGGVEPPPANNLNPPPSVPFPKCRIALRCQDVRRYGVMLGTHCGLVVDTGDGVYKIDGSGGKINSRWVTPGSPSDATGSWTDNDPSVCECLFGNISSWNNRNVPRNNECANSNWNLKCSLKKCNVQVNWGSQSKPIGFDCKDCVRWARVGAVPPGAFACDWCLEWREKPCPDQ